MSNLHSQWQEISSASSTDKQIVADGKSLVDAQPQIQIIRETVVEQPQTIVMAGHNRSGIGSVFAGGLSVLAALGIAGGAYYFSESRDDAANSDTYVPTGQQSGNQIYEITNSEANNYTASEYSSSAEDGGCERKLTAIEGVPGAFTRKGSNTNLCWKLGEIVSDGMRMSGIITLWGESPHAGILDDDLLQKELAMGDISQEELRAFFTNFVLKDTADTTLIVLDREGENYYWETPNGVENVVIELKEEN
jgi:hypothetical protein